MLTDARIAEIRERESKATKGPWEVERIYNEGSYGDGEDVHEGYDSFQVLAGDESVVDTMYSDLAEVELEIDDYGVTAWDRVGKRNADFIAHARQDVPDLLAEVERLRGENAEMRRFLLVRLRDDAAIVCLGCACNVGAVLVADTWMHPIENGYSRCTAPEILDRIAELEKKK